MAIMYAVSANTISLTGYTEGTPCNFTDLYNADKAGTLSLHARNGITGTDGAAVAVDRAERPADYIVLGGASNDLYITITNWVGTTATIRITGTDRSGAAQTEDIVVTANGQYNTTKWFKTITHTQVIVFTATSFDYDLIQGQWGVVSRQCNDSFCLSCHLTIGTDSTTTWFKDTLKTIIFTVASCKFHVRMLATFQLGEKDANGNAYNGCFFKVNDPIFSAFSGTGSSAGNVKLYDSIIYFPAFWRLYRGSDQLVEIIDCRIIKWKGGRIQGTNSIIKGLQFHDTTEYSLTTKTPVGTLEDLKTYRNTYGFYYSPQHSQEATIKGLVGKNNTYAINVNVSASDNYSLYLINAEFDVWNFHYLPAGNYYGTVRRQYEFDLKVQDKDENDINGATVKIWDLNNNLVVNTTTASGVITTQTLNYGYYTQAGGDTPTMQTPHTIQISKAGYQTYKKKFTLDEKIDWRIKLKRIQINIDNETIL